MDVRQLSSSELRRVQSVFCPCKDLRSLHSCFYTNFQLCLQLWLPAVKIVVASQRDWSHRLGKNVLFIWSEIHHECVTNLIHGRCTVALHRWCFILKIGKFVQFSTNKRPTKDEQKGFLGIWSFLMSSKQQKAGSQKPQKIYFSSQKSKLTWNSGQAKTACGLPMKRHFRLLYSPRKV